MKFLAQLSRRPRLSDPDSATPTPDQIALTAARLAAIVESSDEAIVSKKLDGTILSWNAAAERIFGYSAAEMVGASIFTLIPPDLHEDERKILARIARGEHIAHTADDSPAQGRHAHPHRAQHLPGAQRERRDRRRLLHQARHQRAQARAGDGGPPRGHRGIVGRRHHQQGAGRQGADLECRRGADVRLLGGGDRGPIRSIRWCRSGYSRTRSGS